MRRVEALRMEDVLAIGVLQGVDLLLSDLRDAIHQCAVDPRVLRFWLELLGHQGYGQESG